ncbi:MAG: carboxypeptidase-like regulatory domain-containing protein [Flavobacteriaceae bacterium]|nr:carboxypeptidase-like regulatory domain-containing protein [Flavobacteriaceae bacterium]
MKTIFEEIENKTSFNFFYNNTLIDVSKKVSLNVENKELNKILSKLLRKTKIDYRFFKDQIVLFPKNNTSVVAMIDEILVESENVDKKEASIENIKSKIDIAIQDLISGVVSDDSGPLPGVSVIIKGTSKGTETDFDGKYSIDANVGDVLQFSFVGMKTIERTVGQTNIINVGFSLI